MYRTRSDHKKGSKERSIVHGEKLAIQSNPILFLFLAAILTLSSVPARAGTITYQATDLADTTPGEDLWQYSYLLNGFTFPLGFGFDIFFPLSDGFLAGDIKSTPPPNADWDTIALQPDPAIPDDGRYDAPALANNASLANAFVVDFIWRGTGTPGSQRFEIFDANFAVIAQGITSTVPEPTSIVLLLSGVALLWGGKRCQRTTHR